MGALTVHQSSEMASNFMPVFTTETALQRYQAFKDFVKGVLKEDVDFGKIPGTDNKNNLLKPGAEKLCTFFGLTPRYVLEVVIEDWRGEKHGEPLFYYRFKCQLFRGDFQMGEGIGSCSNWEAKYRYRWVDENTVTRLGLDKNALVTRGGAISEFEFAINRAETTGQYGKPAEYWNRWKAAITDGTARKVNKQKKDGSTSPGFEMDSKLYRVPNSEFADIINTVQKIAQKRAYVAATLSATNASDYFTQDVEDYIEAEIVPGPPADHDYIDIGKNKPNTQEAADYVRDRKLAEPKTEEAPAETSPEQPEKPWTDKPHPAAATSLEDTIQAVWKRMMGGEYKRMDEFKAVKKLLETKLGRDEGETLYYGVLNRYGFQHSNAIAKEPAKARQAIAEMYRAT